MPAVLAQATILTLIYSLGVWTGCVLLIAAFLPKPTQFAKAGAHEAPARIVLKGLPVAFSLVLFGLLFRTGIHSLKLLGMCIVLASFGIACLGTVGIALRFADWLAARPALKRLRSGIVPLIAASLLLALPIAIPTIGLLIVMPVLFAICGGVGVSAIGRLAGRRPTQKSFTPYTGMSKTLLLAAGIVLVSCIVPVWRQLSIERDTVAVGMSDGTLLLADVYVPAGPPPYPVVLIQTPYNRRLTDNSNITDGINHGYAVVVEDSRGRNGSQGANLPFSGLTDERPNDGRDTIEWLGTQRWCNGSVGSMGRSAEGINQITTDAAGIDILGAQHISTAAPSMYQYMVYPGGIFRKNFVETWLKKSQFDPKSLADWVAHPKYDEYWISRDFGDRWDRVHWPVMHIGGWYDMLSQGTIDTFVGFQMRGSDGARGKQKLIIGPWGHDLYTSSIGDLTFPDGAMPRDNIQDPWRWFDYTLKGKQDGMEKVPAVTYYVMGDTSTAGAPGNVWRAAESWPPVDTTETPYYLHAGKQLSTVQPGGDSPVSYAFDPKNPVPSTGGPQPDLPDGPIDQRKISERPDVLTFTTGELASPTEVTGRVKMKLYISSDAPDTDFFVKFCDVYPDGRSFNICEGQLRARFRYGFLEEEMLKPGEIYPLDIDLWSTSIIFNKGHKIQVTVTSSNSPAYDVNPNTGEPFRASARTQVAHNTIYMDAAHPSAITLPVARQ